MHFHALMPNSTNSRTHTSRGDIQSGWGDECLQQHFQTAAANINATYQDVLVDKAFMLILGKRDVKRCHILVKVCSRSDVDVKSYAGVLS